MAFNIDPHRCITRHCDREVCLPGPRRPDCEGQVRLIRCEIYGLHHGAQAGLQRIQGDRPRCGETAGVRQTGRQGHRCGFLPWPGGIVERQFDAVHIEPGQWRHIRINDRRLSSEFNMLDQNAVAATRNPHDRRLQVRHGHERRVLPLAEDMHLLDVEIAAHENAALFPIVNRQLCAQAVSLHPEPSLLFEIRQYRLQAKALKGDGDAGIGRHEPEVIEG